MGGGLCAILKLHKIIPRTQGISAMMSRLVERVQSLALPLIPKTWTMRDGNEKVRRSQGLASTHTHTHKHTHAESAGSQPRSSSERRLRSLLGDVAN